MPGPETIKANIDVTGAPCSVGANQATSVPLGNATTCTGVSQQTTQGGSTSSTLGTVTIANTTCPAAPAQSQSTSTVAARTDFMQTTSAAAVNVGAAFNVPNGKCVVLQVTAFGRETAGANVGDGALATINLGFQTVGGVTAAFGVQGAANVSPRDASLATCGFTATIAANTVQLAITGVNATTIDWTVLTTQRMV
jgi:hypothetical protein